MTSAPHGLTRRSLIVGSAGTGAFAMLGMHGKHPARASSTITTPAGNWMHCGIYALAALDDQSVRFIAENYEGVNFRVHNPMQPGDFTNVVQRIHAIRPDMPVLVYTSGATIHRAAPIPEVQYLEHQIMAGYDQLGDLLMPEWPQGDNVQYGDPRNPEFRAWVIGRITSWVDELGASGAFVDTARIIPFRPLSEEATVAYQEGVRTLFAELTSQLGPDRIVMFNGLWSDEDGALPGWFDAQLTLLPHADAAMIEYFGFDPLRRNRADVVPYLPVPAEFPDKILMFCGRGMWDPETYDADYRRQRYDYVAYLLAAGDHAYFKYNASFQQPKVRDLERTGAFGTYADWGVELGDPTGSYKQRTDGLFVREFEQGVVALNPEPAPGEPGQSRTLTLTEPMFDPEGDVYQGSVTVEPGVGLLLLDRPVPPRPVVRIDLSDPDAPGADWRWAQRHSDHLHLDATPPGEEWEHDLMLDPVRSLYAPRTLCVLLRTQDPDARLDVVVEVDDADGAQTRVIVAVGTQAAPLGTPPQLVAPNPFRTTEEWANLRGYADRPAFPANVATEPDGDWHSVRVDIPQILAATGDRYIPHRLVHMRLIGSIDIRTISLGPALDHESHDNDGGRHGTQTSLHKQTDNQWHSTTANHSQ